MKKTPKKPKTAQKRKSKAAVRLRAFFTSLRTKWTQSRERRRSFFRALWRVAWRCGVIFSLCTILMATLVLTVSTSMVSLTQDQVLTPESLTDTLAAGDYDCILVLGAGVKDDGSPSDMLYDRVKTACDLYAAGGGTPLLMSGDHTGDYNEVGVMKALAVELGVPTEDIFLDHEGYSTYESLYRARYVFGAKKIVIITQEYHLHRALYIARELGMEAVGVSADLRPYRGQSRYELREHLARFKDLFSAAKGDYDGHLDPPVDLDGDGNLT